MSPLALQDDRSIRPLRGRGCTTSYSCDSIRGSREGYDNCRNEIKGGGACERGNSGQGRPPLQLRAKFGIIRGADPLALAGRPPVPRFSNDQALGLPRGVGQGPAADEASAPKCPDLRSWEVSDIVTSCFHSPRWSSNAGRASMTFELSDPHPNSRRALVLGQRRRRVANGRAGEYVARPNVGLDRGVARIQASVATTT